MASSSKSKTLYSSNGSPYTLTAYFNETGTSTPNNTSTISLTATLASSRYSFSSNYTSYLTIYWHDNYINRDVQIAQTSFTSLSSGSSKTASGTYTATHNSDGSLSGYAYATFTQGSSSGGWAPASGNVATDTTALTKIPRYATITQTLASRTETSMTIRWSTDADVDKISYSIGGSYISITGSGRSGSYTITGLKDNTSYNVSTKVRRKDSQLESTKTDKFSTFGYPYASSFPTFTIGQNVTIGLYNPLSREVTVSLVGEDGTKYEGVKTTGTSVTLPTSKDLYLTIPNSASGTYKVAVNYTEFTTTASSGTYTINPDDCRGSYTSVTYSDMNTATYSVTKDRSFVVQGLSKVRVVMNGITTAYGATISKGTITVNGKEYNASISGARVYASNLIVDSSTNTNAVVTMIDSRGVATTGSVELTCYEHSQPSAIINVRRQNNYYSETDVKTSCNYSYVSGKNTITISMIATNDDSGEVVSTSLTDNTTSVVNLNNEHSWTYSITITDAFGTTTTYSNLHLSRGMPIIFFDRKNSSVGVNCFPTNEHSLEYNGSEVLTKQGLIDLIYPVGSIYMSLNDVSPQVLFGGTWVKVENKFLIGASSTITVGKEGGSNSKTLTVANLPKKTASFTSRVLNNTGDILGAGTNTTSKDAKTSQAAVNAALTNLSTNYTQTITIDVGGSGTAFDVTPSYLAVNIYKRTA